MRHYAVHRKDLSQDEIVKAIEAAGWEVFTRLPCDLLCYKAGVWRPLEVKTPNKSGNPRKRKDQPTQAAFCERTGVPKVTTPIAALEALGSVYEK